MDTEISVINISGIDCYEKDGVAYLRLETVARGLGFTKKDAKISETGFRKEYIRIDWPRVDRLLKDLGFPNDMGKDAFIPENIFYRLAMKAKSAAAEAFQAKIADEVIPMIRKTGGVYLSADAAERIIEDPDLIISLATMVKEQKAQLAEAQPKVEYYDRLINHGNSLSIRDTAKSIGVKESVLKNALLENQYLYRDKKGRLRPYAEKNKGYFVLKEFTTETGNYASVQTLITVEDRQMILKLLGREDGKEQAV